jgi:mono/diheme cytochrome c family protein
MIAAGFPRPAVPPAAVPGRAPKPSAMRRESPMRPEGMSLRRPLAWLVLAGLAATPAAADERPGALLYRQRCAACHGPSGEGTPDEYPRVLAGDRSLDQITRLIARTMPSDDPGSLSQGEAEAVAAYVFESFYGPQAQARNRPPRIELSRLTVRQYRNAVADLLATFREPPRPDDRQGLQGVYTKGRRSRRGGAAALERIDPEVRFDFGTESPDAEKIEPHEFSIRWEGTVLAPESGEYEFIVRSEHAVRLWVNDPRRPLIDALVKSGDDTEHRASIQLLAGRAYTLRLEFSKAKQGVDDKKAKELPPAPASIALLWKPPGQAAEVIPARHLSPGRASEVFVVAAPFPPDDRSIGYERGTTVSKAWDQATTEAALETAAYVVERLNDLAGTRDDADDRADRLRGFARRFVERAFRRPLTDEQARFYVDRLFDEAPDPEAAIKRVVLLALKSPRFLYHELDGTLDAYDVASRLSFGLWDSLPDQELLAAAAAGRLSTRDDVSAQARRMLGDRRARAKLRGFFHHWLRLDPAPDLAKDPSLFPDFDEEVVSDLRTSLELALDDLAWGDRPDFRRLFLDQELYLNGRLARIYGADLPADASFQKVRLDKGDRSGVLTHPYLLASFAYTANSSPIHRGVFVARGVLGRALRPPPEAFTPLPADLHPNLTTRERVALQTRPESCNSCHGLINPLGFTLEPFDAIGRYRTEEDGHPIDATGAYQTRDGETVSFGGPRDLAAFLAESEETQDAFLTQLFHHLVKQPIRAYGPRRLAELRHAFAARDYDIRALIVEIVAATALTPRDPSPRADNVADAAFPALPFAGVGPPSR